MLLPKDFQNTIADTFYDKSFAINRRTRTKDAEGGTVINSAQIGEYMGNVQNSLSSGVRKTLGIEDRGLTYEINLAVTCSVDVDAKVDDELVYEGIKYTIRGKFKLDSHLVLICEKIHVGQN